MTSVKKLPLINTSEDDVLTNLRKSLFQNENEYEKVEELALTDHSSTFKKENQEKTQ